MVLCTLFSGSSGNCTYIGGDGGGILIDAGASARKICMSLANIGADISYIRAIFVTHEHSDHIQGLPVLSRRYKIPVYANEGTLRGIAQAGREILPEAVRLFSTGETEEIAGMCVSSFATSHDSNESVGYRIQSGDGKSIGVATDLGFVSSEVLFQITGCQAVVLESNHDVRMLENGSYPYFLKRRILSERGHLSNDDCASVLPKLVENGARQIVLAHLSHDNNFPELAVQTAVACLSGCGMKQGDDYQIEAAPRFSPGTLCAV